MHRDHSSVNGTIDIADKRVKLNCLLETGTFLKLSVEILFQQIRMQGELLYEDTSYCERDNWVTVQAQTCRT